MTTPMYVRRSSPPTNPYFTAGIVLVLIGFVLLVLGLEAIVHCTGGPIVSCSLLIYLVTRGIGTALIAAGFVVMLLFRKRVTPLAVLLPKS